jgi:hypothetical protein
LFIFCFEHLAGCVLFDFENGIANWTRTGTAFDNQPTYGDNIAVRHPKQPSHLKGNWLIATFEHRPSPSLPAGLKQGDKPMGTMTSPPVLIRGTKIKFLIGGGATIETEYVALLIDGAIVAKATSRKNGNTMEEQTFDVSRYRGQLAQLRIVDRGSGWGQHINVDHFEENIICSE